MAAPFLFAEKKEGFERSVPLAFLKLGSPNKSMQTSVKNIILPRFKSDLCIQKERPFGFPLKKTVVSGILKQTGREKKQGVNT